MAGGPLHWFRKNQKIMLVVFGVLLMVVFTIGGVLDSLFSGQGQQTATVRTVATTSFGDFTNAEMNDFAEANRNVVDFTFQLYQMAGATADGQSKSKAAYIQPLNNASMELRDRDILSRLALAQFAKDKGMYVGETIIIEYFSKLSNNELGNQGKTIEEFNRELARYSLAAIKDHLKTELLAIYGSQLIRAGFASDRSTPVEIFEGLKRLQERAQIEYMAIPVKDFMDEVLEEPSTEEMKELYEKGWDRQPNFAVGPGFKTPRQVTVGYFAAKRSDFLEAEKAKITDTQVEELYNEWVENEDRRVLEAPDFSKPVDGGSFQPGFPNPPQEDVAPPSDQGGAEKDGAGKGETKSGAPEPKGPGLNSPENTVPDDNKPENNKPENNKPENKAPENKAPGNSKQPGKVEPAKKSETPAKEKSEATSDPEAGGQPEKNKEANKEENKAADNKSTESGGTEQKSGEESAKKNGDTNNDESNDQSSLRPANTLYVSVEQEPAKQESPKKESPKKEPAKQDPAKAASEPTSEAKSEGQKQDNAAPGKTEETQEKANSAEPKQEPLEEKAAGTGDTAPSTAPPSAVQEAIDQAKQQQQTEKPKIKPLDDDIRDLIRTELASDAADEALKNALEAVEAKLADYLNDYDYYINNPDDVNEPEAPNFEKIAAQYGLSFKSYESVDYQTLEKTEFGQAQIQMERPSNPLPTAALAIFFRDFESGAVQAVNRTQVDAAGVQYIYWTLDKKHAERVPFAEAKPAIKEYFQKKKAVEMAKAKAEEIATEVAAENKRLSAVYPEQVRTSEQFGWMETEQFLEDLIRQNPQFGAQFADQLTPKMGTIQPEGEEGEPLDGVTHQMMESIFDLDLNEIGYATDFQQDTLFVFQVISKTTQSEADREKLFENLKFRQANQVAQLEQRQALTETREGNFLMDKYGVKWFGEPKND